MQRLNSNKMTKVVIKRHSESDSVMLTVTGKHRDSVGSGTERYSDKDTVIQWQ